MSDVSIDHLFIKAIGRAGVQFPASKHEISALLGGTELKLSDNHVVRASSLVDAIGPDYFDNGAAFFCAYHSALYRDTWRKEFLSESI
ncbi:MAG: hypothetical protein LBQ58_06645 [Synergistaceae bacterium]|jgi:hypothetical protein|nr:hypothetical protein [Synergistaceae bacterium]